MILVPLHTYSASALKQARANHTFFKVLALQNLNKHSPASLKLLTLVQLLTSGEIYTYVDSTIIMEIPELKYVSLWNKYRPTILKMLLDAADTPQQYKFTELEFKALDDKKRGGFGFNLSVSDSKATNNIKDSEVAQGLLSMLLMSRKGSELIQANAYELAFDKHFVLHIHQIGA